MPGHAASAAFPFTRLFLFGREARPCEDAVSSLPAMKSDGFSIRCAAGSRYKFLDPNISKGGARDMRAIVRLASRRGDEFATSESVIRREYPS